MNKSLLVLFLCGSGAWGQADPLKDVAIRRYLGDTRDSRTELSKALDTWNNKEPGTRPVAAGDISLQSLLPTRRPDTFPVYITATRYERTAALAALSQVADSQMNKMLGGTAGGSGSTSLLSNSVAADFLSLATEYGAIAQTSAGNVTTLRANLLGISGVFAGNPYLGCLSLAVGGCSEASRWLRGFSSSLSVATPSGSGATVGGTHAATGATATASILAGGYRMRAWSVRFDWFRKTLYDLKQTGPDFLDQWVNQLKTVSASNAEKELSSAIQDVMKDVTGAAWQKSFIDALQNAPKGQLEIVLEEQLDSVINSMASKDPQFMTRVQRAQNAILASFVQRDGILQSLQNNRFSTEFNSLHPLGQPNLSNVRLIYSYQPGKAPLLLTTNLAAEWYDTVPVSVKVGKLRDLQAAVQMDRRLGYIPQMGPATLTLAYYYQWMKHNALITIPPGNTAPGTGIVLPGTPNTLLATKGNIDIFQAKVTVPIKGGLVKVPVSFTWSNRTELINESEKRGQIGLTLDVDSVFKK